MSLLPVLYSFRRCPYAMRARMAIYTSRVDVEIREVHLADKPNEMLEVSPKATVPVLVTTSNEVFDESLDIMRWAMNINDQQGWLAEYSSKKCLQMDDLIVENDFIFKQHLDHYKYADRFPENSAEYYRQQGEVFLAKLEQLLGNSHYLFSEEPSFADIAIFPFIRQFASVDICWFEQSRYVKLQRWLQQFLVSEQFLRVMDKYPAWKPGNKTVIFSYNPIPN